MFYSPETKSSNKINCTGVLQPLNDAFYINYLKIILLQGIYY
jgi:hypothetical protein